MEKYKLLKANNIPICPLQHDFQYRGQLLEFNLVFEALPKTTSNIDIIEDEVNGGFNFFGVSFLTTTNINSVARPATEECDDIDFTAPSPKPSFENMLAGVKNALIIGKADINGHIPAFNALEKYS